MNDRTLLHRLPRLLCRAGLALALLALAGCAPPSHDVPATATTAQAQPALPRATAAPTTIGTPATVTRIVDGDTIEVIVDGATHKVRYILINTPETGQPYAAEATTANSDLVLGKTVYLVKDVSETDRYGRLLRYVYLADGTFVNAEMVRQGFAQMATYPPDVSMEAVIRAAEVEARAAGRGLWVFADLVDGAPTSLPVVVPERGGAVAVATPAGGGGLRIVAVDKRAEFVDLRNDGAAALDLAGWVLRSERGSQDCPLAGVIGPGVTLRVWALVGEDGFSCGFDGNIWNNSERDPAVLIGPDGRAVDRWE